MAKTHFFHPGKILKIEFLDEYGLSVKAAAEAMRMPRSRLNDIVRGTRGITADTALRLSRYFGRSARFWSTRDMSKMQSLDEGDQRPHLPQAAEMEVSEVRQGQDAEAEVTGEYFSLLRAHRLLMYIRQSAPSIRDDNTTFSVPEIKDIEASTCSVSEFGDFSTMGFTMIGLGEPR